MKIEGLLENPAIVEQTKVILKAVETELASIEIILNTNPLAEIIEIQLKSMKIHRADPFMLKKENIQELHVLSQRHNYFSGISKMQSARQDIIKRKEKLHKYKCEATLLLEIIGEEE